MAAQAGDAAAPGGAELGASLYVVGLDDNVTESQLHALFSSIGEVVSVEVCQDLSIGLPLRYGYVNYKNPECAQRAVEELNFTCLNRKRIKIMCRHQEPSTSRSGAGIVDTKNSKNKIDSKAVPEKCLSVENIESCSPDASGWSMGYGSDDDSTQKGLEENSSMPPSLEPSISKLNIELSEDKANFTNVFVKNFCASTTEDDLKNIFGEFGLIKSAVVMKSNDGTSKCFGFVNFENAEDAARAVASLNGQIFGKKKWYVGRSQNKHERQLELKHHLECVKKAFDNGSNLYVKNLDRSIDDEKLKELFCQFGSVMSCKVLRDETGNSKNCGFVGFSSTKEASAALSGMNGRVVFNKPLCIAIAQRKEDKRAPLQNLGKEMDQKARPETFSSYGDIYSSKVTEDTFAHTKGYGILQLSGEETGQAAIGGTDNIVGKFSGAITKLNVIIEEFNSTVKELNGLLLKGKQINMQHSLTKEIELLVEKANFTIVFVKNFCPSTTEEDLKKIFGEFGLVTDTVIMRNEDGTSKCFGFVNFKNTEDAASAVEFLHGQRFYKNKWNSGAAQEKLDRELEPKNSIEKCVKESVSKQSNLYVKNLSDSIDDEKKLKELFSSFGLVTSCKVNRDREGRSKRSGFVAFSSPEEASRALCEMNGKILFGKPLKVAITQRKEERIGRLQSSDKENDHKALPETLLSSVNTGSCKVGTDGSARPMGSQSLPSGEGSLQVATKEHNVMLLNGKEFHIGSSHDDKERRLSLDKPYLTNLYIKNICESTTEDDLMKIFGEFGLVTSTVVMRNKDKTSKCFGYVNFENAEDAARAVESLNGQIFNKKTWYVGIAQKSIKREPKLNHQFEEVYKGSNPHFENLDNSIANGKLSEVFSPSRSLKSCEVMRDRSRITRERAFVALSPPEQASESLSQKKGECFSFKPLDVAQAQIKEDRRAQLQELRGPGVRPARPFMHGMSVSLIQNQQRESHPGGRHISAGPIQKNLEGLAPKQQMLPRGHDYRRPPGGMFSVRYETGRLQSCDVVVGGLASSLANASSLNSRRCWVKLCTPIVRSWCRVKS